ncbi:NAD(P)H oxidoreductase [Flavobacterium sp. NST-5]|uniref:NAD(P)H oxidoreductase n=1 Tax=Flavobacterium ichthyis TaxID=2698827 RepID=A0ABW9ZAA1_9FLAO|nr:NAD(P)H-dependent oxidoreductase [Flavobacterium ichthyis]NBL64020.1 NAD(P)H oxidoreductase [Flavobacterium ichthyis]
MPKKILILFAHPLFEKSLANKILVDHIPDNVDITFHDLYERYPEFDIDVQREQNLLAGHDIIIWQHPMFWYGCPPLLKQWIDMVLEHGWAYGSQGNALKGKIIFQVITTGGKKENYSKTGRDHFTIPELLQPFCQTAEVCKMKYLPPFVVHGTFKITRDKCEEFGVSYKKLLNFLLENELDMNVISEHFYLNDFIKKEL